MHVLHYQFTSGCHHPLKSALAIELFYRVGGVIDSLHKIAFSLSKTMVYKSHINFNLECEN